MDKLMIKRVKVQGLYPDCPFKLGEVLTLDIINAVHDMGYVGDCDYYVTEKQVADYPHIFKPLAWYEDRELSELPEYVKHEGLGTVCKIEFYRLSGKMPYITAIDGTTSYDMYIKGFIPATESEYIAHAQLKQNEK